MVFERASGRDRQFSGFPYMRVLDLVTPDSTSPYICLSNATESMPSKILEPTRSSYSAKRVLGRKTMHGMIFET